MTISLKSFFDLDKVVFTKPELELPYENIYFKTKGEKKNDNTKI